MPQWKHPFHSLATRLSLVVLAAGLLASFALVPMAERPATTGASAPIAANPSGAVQSRVAVGDGVEEDGSEPIGLDAPTHWGPLAAGLGISLLAALGAQWIATRFLQPFEALVDAVGRMSNGEDDVDLPASSGHSEVARLSQGFAEMRARLDDRAARLEKSQGHVERVNQQLRLQNEELQRVNEVLEQLSITDGLTKLHNHRFFQEYLTREVKRAERSAEPLGLVLIDIDHFKQWNDRLGHAAGDQILRRVAEVMNGAIRETDLLARYGGEEFALLLPNTDWEGAVSLAEKIRHAIASTQFVLAPPSERRSLTVSIGVALYEGDRSGMFNRADRALYAAKEQGRDCVMSARDVEEGLLGQDPETDES